MMSFRDIKGQDKTIERLKKYLTKGTIFGTYLFSGPQGVGKRMTAFALAKAMHCAKENLDSCDVCPACLKIQKNQHPDIFFLGGSEDEIKIEDIRQLQSNINLRSYSGKKKIFIIDHAHTLTLEASHAFLKTLEEGPGDSLIILISDKPALLLQTIVSRCQVFKFYPLKISQVQELLKKNYSLPDNLAHFLAYFSEGRLGGALKLKDSSSDILAEKNRVIDEFATANRSKTTVAQIQNKDGIRHHLNILASWFRDIYLLKTGIPCTELINLDRKADLFRVVNRYSLARLNEIFSFISNSLLYLEQNVNLKLLVANLKLQLQE